MISPVGFAMIFGRFSPCGWMSVLLGTTMGSPKMPSLFPKAKQNATDESLDVLTQLSMGFPFGAFVRYGDWPGSSSTIICLPAVFMLEDSCALHDNKKRTVIVAISLKVIVGGIKRSENVMHNLHIKGYF